MTRVMSRHFGPPLPEFNSVWWKVFIYEEVGAGPPTILYPRGTRVTHLPSIFLSYERLSLMVGQHEPLVVPTANLLPTLNEALVSNPVWVQAYAYVHKPTLVYVPFPVHPPPEDLPVTDWNRSNLEYHPLVQKVQEKLGLQYGFGYITLANYDNLNLPDNPRWEESADDEKEDDEEEVAEEARNLCGSKMVNRTNSNNWVPVDVTFGMPLFDPQLNKAVCDRIASFQLFSEENLAQYTKHNQYLANALLDYIESHQAEHYKYEVEPGQIPPPTRILTFPGE
jgi:hypothetical protein